MHKRACFDKYKIKNADFDGIYRLLSDVWSGELSLGLQDDQKFQQIHEDQPAHRDAADKAMCILKEAVRLVPNGLDSLIMEKVYNLATDNAGGSEHLAVLIHPWLLNLIQKIYWFQQFFFLFPLNLIINTTVITQR